MPTLTQRVNLNSCTLWGVTFVLVVLILGQSLPQRTHAPSNRVLTGALTPTSLSESASGNDHCDHVSMHASTMKKSVVTPERARAPMMVSHTDSALSHSSNENIPVDCCGDDCQCPSSLCGSTIAYMPVRVLPSVKLANEKHISFLTGTPVATTFPQFKPPKHTHLV